MNLYICREVSHLRKTCQGLAGKVWRGAQREKREKRKIASTEFTENLESLESLENLESLEHPESANKKTPTECSIQSAFTMYPEPGSNRHGLPHWCLRPARLPIPPSGLDSGAKVREKFYRTKYLLGICTMERFFCGTEGRFLRCGAGFYGVKGAEGWTGRKFGLALLWTGRQRISLAGLVVLAELFVGESAVRHVFGYFQK